MKAVPGGTPIIVRCHAGHRADERPLAFDLGGGEIRVAAVLDQWFDPASRAFKVSDEEGNIYILRHDERTDLWDLVFYRSRKIAEMQG